MKRIINPFVYLGGGRALAWGLAGLAAASVIATRLGLTFRGGVSLGYGDWPLWKTALAQLLVWGIFATLLYLCGLVLSKSRIRAVDVYGTNLFARLPFIGVMLLAALPGIRAYTDSLLGMTFTQAEAMIPPVSVIFFALVVLFVLVWYFVWTYNGYVVSTNLRKGRAAVSFIVCYILAEVLSALVWNLIF